METNICQNEKNTPTMNYGNDLSVSVMETNLLVKNITSEIKNLSKKEILNDTTTKKKCNEKRIEKNKKRMERYYRNKPKINIELKENLKLLKSVINDIKNKLRQRKYEDSHKSLHTCQHCKKEFYAYRSSNKMYCSQKCSRDKRSEQIKYEIRNGIHPKIPYRDIVYKILCEDFGNKCVLCGLNGNNWKEKPIRMIVDHIDGNPANNLYSNFRLVCPNCESQLPTSKGRNWGKGRTSRGLSKR